MVRYFSRNIFCLCLVGINNYKLDELRKDTTHTNVNILKFVSFDLECKGERCHQDYGDGIG